MSLCAQFKDDISALIDGELDSSRNSELQEHLNSCADCQQEHGSVRQISSLLAQAKLASYAACPDIWSAMAGKMPPLCEIIQEDFSAYLDGELIVPAKEGVSDHLQACTPCHGKFQDLSQVNGMLSRGLELPANLEINIWAEIKNRLDEDCQLIKDELSSFYDRELTPDRHRTITSHLLECGDCREQLALISQAGEMLRSSYQPEFPDNFDLWPEIKAKMNVIPLAAAKEKRQNQFVNKRLYAFAAVFVGGALAALTIFLNFNAGASVKPVTAESYLIESALGEPAEMAEAMVYENQ